MENAAGPSPFVLVCDHASNRIPERYGDMGLAAADRASHIAWDPGALELSMALSRSLDAPVVHSTVSRLLIDPNRAPDATNAIWTLSEATRIAVNERLDAAERRYRIETFHQPYHDAIDALIRARDAGGRETILICIHSFTPVYLGVERPWPIGLLHGRDPGFTASVRDALAAMGPALNIGWNEPYAALNGVTYTLEKHGDGRGLLSTMIEVRNNEIGTAAGVALWAKLLAAALEAAHDTLGPRINAGPAAVGAAMGS